MAYSINYLKLTIFLLAGIGVLLLPEFAFAQQIQTPDCVGQFNGPAGGAGERIVTSIVETIVGLLQQTSKTLYTEIIKPGSVFIQIRDAAILLAVTIYGVMILFKLQDFKPGVIISLIFKIGFIIAMTSPTGWEFFNSIIGDFFFNTMVELVNVFSGQAAISLTGSYIESVELPKNLSAPLVVFNYPMAQIVSTQFFITIIGVFAIPNFGIIVGILLIIGAFNIVMTLLGALVTYIKSIVGLWFLFALAPIFFVCLLFSRTRGLFDGWINMVVGFTLEPILLFAFLAFFITIVTVSLGQLMTVEWCWEAMKGTEGGGASEIFFWQPMSMQAANGDTVSLKQGLYTLWGFRDSANGLNQSNQFPLDIQDVLFFVLASYVAAQYQLYVPRIANELSASGINLSSGGESMKQYFKSRGFTPEQMASNSIGFINKGL